MQGVHSQDARSVPFSWGHDWHRAGNARPVRLRELKRPQNDFCVTIQLNERLHSAQQRQAHEKCVPST